MNLSRRKFFGILAAPAIVRASSLMPLSVWHDPLDQLRIEGWKIMSGERLVWTATRFIRIPLPHAPFYEEILPISHTIIRAE